MWIYIAHTRGTSNALNTLILVKEKCLECPPKCIQNPLVGLEASSRQLVRRLKMLDGRMYYVDGAVWSAGNDLHNVVADDWRCLKLERSSLYQILLQWRSFADKMELVQCELGASVYITRTRYAVRSVASDGLPEPGWQDHVDQDAPQHGWRRSELVAMVLWWI